MITVVPTCTGDAISIVAISFVTIMFVLFYLCSFLVRLFVALLQKRVSMTFNTTTSTKISFLPGMHTKTVWGKVDHRGLSPQRCGCLVFAIAVFRQERSSWLPEPINSNFHDYSNRDVLALHIAIMSVNMRAHQRDRNGTKLTKGSDERLDRQWTKNRKRACFKIQ